jgi:hypothetical protein
MAITKDGEILLMALSKERDEAYQRVLSLDRLIRKIKGEYFSPKSNRGNNEDGEIIGIAPREPQLPLTPNNFPKGVDIKVQVLRVFDSLKIAVKLKEVQTEYTKLSGSSYNIREIVRSLHKSRLLRLIKEKDAKRGIFWVKADWIDNGLLLDEFKPAGFDMLYKGDNLEYE